MRNWPEFVKIFIGGFLWDAIISLDVVVTADRSPVYAGLTTAIITIISFTLYDKVIGRDGLQKSRLYVLALGSALGAGLTLSML